MKFTSTITAINPKTGELYKWRGPNVEALTFEMAQHWCDENGLGYCEVDGILREYDEVNNKILPLENEN